MYRIILRMTKRNQIKTYHIFSFLNEAIFITAIIVPFLLDRGFGLDQALQILLISKITIMLFEVPTGVVGDRYGHRVSILAGLAIEILALIILVTVQQKALVIGSYLLIAIAYTFQSGSDTALLHNLSSNFKRDLSNNQSIRKVAIALASFMAGFAFAFDSNLPLLLMVVMKTLALVTLFAFINDPRASEPEKNTSIKETLKLTKELFKKHTNIIPILLVIAFSAAVAMQYKYLGNTIFELEGINVSYIGVFMSGLMVISIAGNQLAKVERFKWWQAYLIGLLVLITSIFVSPILALGLFFVARLVSPTIFVNINNKLMKVAGNQNRSTLLSIKNLAANLVYSVFLFAMGEFAVSNQLDIYLAMLVAIGIGVLGVWYFTEQSKV